MLPGTDDRSVISQTTHINSIPVEYQSSWTPITRLDIIASPHTMPETANQLAVSGTRGCSLESVLSNLGQNFSAKPTVDWTAL